MGACDAELGTTAGDGVASGAVGDLIAAVLAATAVVVAVLVNTAGSASARAIIGLSQEPYLATW